MKRNLRTMFLCVEINLLMWIMLCGMAWSAARDRATSWVGGDAVVSGKLLLVGLVFAAIIQHWAYYSVRKAANNLDDSRQET